MSPKIERKIELYKTQAEFVQCADRFTAFIGGIGSGKTYAGCAKAIVNLARPRTLGMIVAPTYPMLRDATLRTFLDMAGDMVRDMHKTVMIAEMCNGSEVLFRSADDPDRLRGPNLHWAYIDEAALIAPETWEIVIGRLRADGQAGPCWVTTTPKGRNWLFERQDQMTVFRAKTRDNPYLDREFIASLEAAYTGAFARQELEGEFVSFEGLVYEEFERSVHVAAGPPNFVRVVAGVDEGYTNPAVILVIGIDSDGRAHVIEEFYRRRVLQGDVVARAKSLHDQYRFEMMLVDPSAAGLIAEMRNAHLPVREADNAVHDGIQRVKARLARAGDGRPRLTISPSCVNLLAEIESYVWREGKQGVKDEPEKINDHAMDALRYAVMYIDRGVAKLSAARNPFYG